MCERNLIAGCVVLYNPGDNLINNLNSYLVNIEKLYIVDNSPSQTNLKLDTESQAKIEYIYLDENLGIATALNIASRRAINDGFKWLLTMDQDSIFEENNFINLIDDLDNAASRGDNIGILTPSHKLGIQQITNTNTVYLKEIKTCMTSGNLLNLSVWEKAGAFNEKLFIDYVDHEFCLRIRKKGFLVMQSGRAELKHNLGDIVNFKFMGKQLTASHHNYIRRYYITRNRFYFIWNNFTFEPGLCLKEIYNFGAETIKIVLNERGRLKKIHSILLGFRDFALNRFGKYRY